MTDFGVLLRVGRRLEDEGFHVHGERLEAQRLAALILGAPAELVVLAEGV